MMQKSYRGLLLTLALFGAVADLGTKYAAFRWLNTDGYGGEREVVPGWFKFIVQFSGRPIETDNWRGPLQAWNGPTLPRVNDGALFGIGQAYEGTANMFFAAVSLAAAVAILIWALRTKHANDVILCSALGLILGGTVGNLFDRVVFHGVRDFLYFYKIEWPVFNVADMCLVAGAGLLLLQALVPAKSVPAEAPAA